MANSVNMAEVQAQQRSEDTRSFLCHVKRATGRTCSPEENARIVVEGFRPTIEMSQPTRRNRAPEGPAAFDAIRTYNRKHEKGESPPLVPSEELVYALGGNRRREEPCIYVYGV